MNKFTRWCFASTALFIVNVWVAGVSRAVLADGTVPAAGGGTSDDSFDVLPLWPAYDTGTIKAPYRTIDGTEYSDFGGYAQKIEELTAAIAKDPANASNYYQRGLNFMRVMVKSGASDIHGNRKRAREDFTKALELNPKSAQAYAARGQSYDLESSLEEGDLPKQLDDLGHAIALKPQSATYYILRGNARAGYMRIAEVLEAGEGTAVDWQTHDAGSFTRAKEDYDKAIALAPKSPSGYWYRAELLANSAKTAEAATADYLKVLSLAPNNINPIARLVDIYKANDDLPHAIEMATKGVQLLPREGMPYAVRSELYGQQGKLNEALKDADTAINLGAPDAQLAQIRLLRARIRAAKNEADGALEDYDAVVKFAPTNTEARRGKGSILAEKGKTVEALAEYDAAIAAAPLEGENYTGRGTVFYGQKKYTEAIADFSQATKLSPGSSRAWDQLGISQTLSGKPDDGAATFRKAIEQFPGSNFFRFRLALTLSVAGDADAAAKAYTDVLPKATPDEIRQEVANVQDLVKTMPDSAALKAAIQTLKAALPKN